MITLHSFTFNHPRPDGLPGPFVVTSVVMDETDFLALCDFIADEGLSTSHDVNLMRSAEHIPLMRRGTKTEFIFSSTGILTDFASFIVRGSGASVLLGMLSDLN